MELSDTKINLATTQADLLTARSDLRYHRINNCVENVDTEWELQQTSFELPTWYHTRYMAILLMFKVVV